LRVGPGPDTDEWDLVIKPEAGLLEIHLDELWRYRDLIALFIYRDFVAQFKQTVLGPAWFVLQPLLTALTFTVVFGNIVRLDTAGVPKLLFYLSGNILWLYVAACVLATADTFRSSAPLFGKVYFPRLAVPIALVASQTIRFVLQFAFFLCFWAVYAGLGAPVHINWVATTLPLLMLILGLLALGLGIVISAATTKYRDLQYLVQFGVQLAMYTTTVIYPLSSLHGGRFRYLILLNPVTPVIEAFRYGFLGTGTLSWPLLAYSGGAAVVLVIVGGLLFTRIERTFMDTI
jgi:lipopolysaccharide transport system permease protein